MNDRDLRQAWIERSGGDEEPCVETGRIWQAVNLELPTEERLQVVEHAAGCAACAEAWRLATQLAREDSAAKFDLRLLGSVAAILLVAIGLAIWSATAVRHSDPPTAWRDSDTTSIASMLDDRAALPIDEFELRWSPGPQGTVYDIEVGTPDLKILNRATALDQNRYRVPAEKLESLSGGDTVAWRVIATYPSGERILSVTFFNTLAERSVEP